MYDLSGSDSINSKSREWIEIYNNGGSDVAIDASIWRINDGSANRTINGEVNFSIPAGAFVIFAGDKDTFLVDHPSFGGVVYDTGITTLNNTGALLKLLDQNGNIVDSFAYTSSLGGAGDGNTLQKISGSWAGASPTPGVTNETAPPPSSSSSSDSTPATSSTTSSGGTGEDPSLKNFKKEQKIKTKISAKNFAFVGVPVEFEANTTGYYGEMLPYGKYFWNFGDGDFKEMKVNEEKFSHIYFYPGEYAVSLEYYMNYASANPEAVDKIIIKTIAPDVLISNIGDEADFFVELTNGTNYDADISQWILSGDKINFTLPKNTVLGPQKKIILSPRITNLSITDKDFLKLMTPQRDVIFDYTASLAPVFKKVSVQNQLRQSEKIIFDNSNSLLIPQEENKNAEITTQDLSASPILAGAKENNLYFIILFIFLGITSGAVYFIRRAKNTTIAGDDFELLDE